MNDAKESNDEEVIIEIEKIILAILKEKTKMQYTS